MSKIWGVPLAENRGPKSHLFRRLRNLTATLSAYIFGMKGLDSKASALETTRIYIVSKFNELWCTNGLK